MLGLLIWVTLGGGLSRLTDMGRGVLGRRPVELVRQDFVLAPDKADALFDLLRPRDVKVLVGRRDGGVFVRGTPEEVSILNRLVGLLTRLEGHAGDCMQDSIQELRTTWTERQTYKLPRHKARALFHMLAFDDVPVYVHEHKSRVIVDATKADQEVLSDVVRILRGHR